MGVVVVGVGVGLVVGGGDVEGVVALYPSIFQFTLKPAFVAEESERKSIQSDGPLEVMVAGLLLPQYLPTIGLLEDEPSRIST